MAESEKIEQEESSVVDEALKFLEGTAPFIMSNDMNPHVFCNDVYNPVPYGLIDMFYRLVSENRVGIMVALDAETGEQKTVLCFVGDRNDEDVDLFPVAVLLNEYETQRYRAPVGDGKFYEPAPVEA